MAKLGNLCHLAIGGVDFSSLHNLLFNMGHQLESLSYVNFLAGDVDFWALVCSCPKLKFLHVGACALRQILMIQ